MLALELRAAIDMARRSPRYVDIVKDLMEAHPHGSTSRHIEHNLGDARLGWLYENGLLPKPRVRTGDPLNGS
jgi:hypothetical protein